MLKFPRQSYIKLRPYMNSKSHALPRLNQHAQHLSIMPTTNSTSTPLRILMLHGYTQNGPLFHAKTKALEKFLQKSFPGVQLSYPTGPMRLKLSDIPGMDPSKFDATNAESAENYAWWRRADNSDPPEYFGLEEGLSVVAETLESEGPFDGVMGFSQGACLAAMVASLLEGESRKEAFRKAQTKSSFGIEYPPSFDSLDHPPLKFCVSYCGFASPGPRYAGLYENPCIQTPMCHVNGSLDSVVEEDRTELLITAAGGRGKTQVVMHPGGHFVPSGKQYLEVVSAFIKATTSSVAGKKIQEEERVEDMDVPF